VVRRMRIGFAVLVALVGNSAAPAQRVQFPTRLPASTPVQVAQRTAIDRNVEAISDPEPEPDRELSTTPQFTTGYPPLTVEAPEVFLTEPCAPTCTTAPCYVEPAPIEHRWQLYGDFLWIQPRGIETTYAVPFDGPIAQGATPVPIGPAGVVDSEWTPAFRVGGAWMPVSPTRIGVAYTRFESNVTDAFGVNPPDVIRALVLHPGTDAADADFLDAGAAYGIDFELIDAEYRSIFFRNRDYTIDYLVGARYSKLQQDFVGTFSNATTVEHLDTRIAFDGVGLRLGMEGERRAKHLRGLLLYGRASASLLAGKFRAHYAQNDNIQGIVAQTNWHSERVVPLLEMELGIGWTGPAEHLRVSAGYMFNAWYNTVQTGEFIQAVRTADFVDLGDTLTFDGLVGRVELRF